MVVYEIEIVTGIWFAMPNCEPWHALQNRRSRAFATAFASTQLTTSSETETLDVSIPILALVL
jgi:hypothetical protein